MAWLDENPPVRSQFRHPRREAVSGVFVVHTAENVPDTVATDGGAEAVAQFIVGRSDPGSYHWLADSDSGIQLVEWGDEAYHDGTGSNPHSIGLSVATTAAWWPWAPEAWRNGAITQLAIGAAAAASYVQQKRGILVPARRITRAESELRVPGFISHAERDPARRSDPGAQFPWVQFLGEYAAIRSGSVLPPTGDDDMYLVQRDTDGAVGHGAPGYWKHLTAAEWDAVRSATSQPLKPISAPRYDALRAACLHGERCANDARG